MCYEDLEKKYHLAKKIRKDFMKVAEMGLWNTDNISIDGKRNKHKSNS